MVVGLGHMQTIFREGMDHYWSVVYSKSDDGLDAIEIGWKRQWEADIQRMEKKFGADFDRIFGKRKEYTMIKPSIGRVMLYWPVKEHRGDQPWPALVSYVHGDNMVNLTVWNADGHAQNGKTSVPIVQDGSPYTAGDSPYAEWMPYQKAVASGEIAPNLHATKA